MGGDMSTMRNAFRPAAEKQAKVNVTLAKIIETEGITVSEEEIAAEYETVAKQYELELDKVKTMVPEEEIKSSLETRKAVKVIVDSSVAVAPKKAAPKKKRTTTKKTTKAAEEKAAEETAEEKTSEE